MKENNKITFKSIWGLIMSIIYLGIAYLVVFTPRLLPYNFRENSKANDDFEVVRILLGFALCLYGIYRGYQSIKQMK
jgi:hypothetical protein